MSFEMNKEGFGAAMRLRGWSADKTIPSMSATDDGTLTFKTDGKPLFAAFDATNRMVTITPGKNAHFTKSYAGDQWHAWFIASSQEVVIHTGDPKYAADSKKEAFVRGVTKGLDLIDEKHGAPKDPFAAAKTYTPMNFSDLRS